MIVALLVVVVIVFIEIVFCVVVADSRLKLIAVFSFLLYTIRETC